MTKTKYALVAQLVEHITDTDGVPGSNPGRRTREEYSNCFEYSDTCASRSHIFLVRKLARRSYVFLVGKTYEAGDQKIVPE